MRSKIFNSRLRKHQEYYKLSERELTKIKHGVAEGMKKIRLSKKLSQFDVASTGIITQAQLSLLENCKRNITVIEIIQLAALYNIALDKIIPVHAQDIQAALLLLTKGQ